jgi:cell division protein FtsB
MIRVRFFRFDILVSVGCVALLCSFAWYGMKGPRGFAYKANLQTEIAAVVDENVKLSIERSVLEKQVRLMRPDGVDRDMLEQLARTELKMAYPNEVTVKLED